MAVNCIVDPTVGPYLGPYGSPRGGAVSYERGTPVYDILYALHPSTHTLRPTPYQIDELSYAASERGENTLKRFEDFNLKAKARIWA